MPSCHIRNECSPFVFRWVLSFPSPLIHTCDHADFYASDWKQVWCTSQIKLNLLHHFSLSLQLLITGWVRLVEGLIKKLIIKTKRQHWIQLHIQHIRPYLNKIFVNKLLITFKIWCIFRRRRRRRRCDSSPCQWTWGACSRGCGGGTQSPRVTRRQGSCGSCHLPGNRRCNTHCCPGTYANLKAATLQKILYFVLIAVPLTTFSTFMAISIKLLNVLELRSDFILSELTLIKCFYSVKKFSSFHHALALSLVSHCMNYCCIHPCFWAISLPLKKECSNIM